MLVTYNWLKEFVDIPMYPNELGERLTMQGLEVASVRKVGIDLTKNPLIGVAKIVSLEKHPKADNLTICKVGDDKKVVVTNSPNVAKGDFVVYAQPGALLPNGITVKETKIKEQVSEGMLLPKEYLQIEDKSADIWILGKDAKSAEVEFRIFVEEDYVLEIELTANRSDCLSVLGVAREVAAMLGKPLKLHNPMVNENLNTEPDIEITERTLCPRYTSRILTGIEVRESPSWVKRRLSLCGLRPINNIVDATNYVLLELGHPTHAFDLNRLDGKKIIVRSAKKGETITALDGTECRLTTENLVIADEKKAVAIAGVMGGANSEILENTKDLLLESAYFDPVSIRRTSAALKIKSEASYRFERTADWGITPIALDRICEIIMVSSPAKVSRMVDRYVSIIKDKVVTIKDGYISEKLGVQLALKDVEEYLKRLQFQIMVKRENSLEVKIPSFRSDVARAIDLAEEIARIYGYNSIPETSFRAPTVLQGLGEVKDIKSKIREILTGIGFSEVYNYSFMDPADLQKFRIMNKSVIPLENPMAQDASLLRNYLFMGLVKNIEYNEKSAYRHSSRFFEIGNIFKHEQDYSESERLCFAVWGKDESYETLLGIAEMLLTRLGTGALDFKKAEFDFTHPENCSIVFSDDKKLGFLGELHPDIQDEIDLRYPVYFVEFNLAVLEDIFSTPIEIKPIGKFPPTDRDISLVVDEKILARDVLNTILSFNEWIKKVEFVDLYSGGQIGGDKKSLTYSILFQSGEKTLSDTEVNQVMDDLVKKLEKQFEAELRS
ncbi:MAG: phenylalanine--tRNA ligase subunit beta [Spirochaetes bacterium GWF1_51_8]|nr:MAG: phenylalanine--tRNA ligase subunit beta [Spirochaetes bacterium GWF1_51_8]